MDPRSAFRQLFGAPRALIGMVHVGALPGTPSAHHSVERLMQLAVAEARVYRDAGFSAVAVENMHDRPYVKGNVGPEITAAMAVIGREIKRETGLPLGVQVLAAANLQAMAVANACGAEFVRVEGYVFAHVADEGIIQSNSGDLLRYRRAIGAERVRVFADIKKKHSAHALTADVDLAETARAAEFCLADGVIVTGVATGREATAEDVRAVRPAVAIQTFVGSGITPDNLERFADADGWIVGSAAKRDGVWSNELDPARVRALVEAHRRLEPRA